MKRRLGIAAVLCVLLPALASGHRLDEYLEATLLWVEPDRVDVSMRLVPGVAVAATVIPSIDTNGDGTLSPAEEQAYAQRVLKDLSLSIDGKPLALRVVAAKFPSVPEMKSGMGQIQLDLTAATPRGGAQRRVAFENRHLGAVAVYLVNCLVPRDPNIRITAQRRNRNQSSYQLDFEQTGEAQP